MHKKITVACMAIAAFAIMPTTASAVQIGETSGGIFSALAVGSQITGTQNGNSRMTDKNGNILVECSLGIMTGELTENGPTVIKGDITSAAFNTAGGAACPSFLSSTSVVTTKIEDAGHIQTGVPWCLSTNKGTDTFEVRGGKCGEAARALKFILDNSFAGECEYSKASIGGTFATDFSGQEAVATVDNTGAFGKIRGGVFCPTEGYLDMSFKLETDDGTGTPLYIK